LIKSITIKEPCPISVNKNKGRKENKMNFTLEDLIDLEAARIANAEIEMEEREEFEEMLQSCVDLPGQVVIFTNDEYDYPY